MTDLRVTELIDSLPAHRLDYAPVYETISRWAKGAPALLVDFVSELRAPEVQHFAKRALQALCFEPSPAAADAAVEAALRMEALKDPGGKRRPELSHDTVAAAWLAANHPREHLTKLLVQRAGDEEVRHLFACWTQELVIRGHSFAGDAHVEVLWDALRDDRHALASLPLSRLELEAGFEEQLPRESLNGSSHAIPFHVDAARLVELTAAPTTATRLATPPSLKSAINHWHTSSNGELDLGVFALTPPSRTIDGRVLTALGLASIGDVGEAEVKVNALEPAQAATWLFAAAAQSSMYGQGLRGAFGRLAAWRSVQGFTGAGEPFELTRLEGAVARCRWASFSSGSAWFTGIVELGLACLREGGASIAVLAATDTD